MSLTNKKALFTLKKSLITLLKVLGLIVLTLYMLQAIKKGNDFMTFHDVGIFFLNFKSIYQPSPTTGMYVFYLPSFLAVILPFALFPAQLAAGLWFITKILGYRFYFQAFKRRLQQASTKLKKRDRYLVFAPLLSFIPFIDSDFMLGQINSLVVFLLLTTFILDQRGQQKAAGLCFYLASAKVTPLIFLVWFIAKKRARLLLTFALCHLMTLSILHLWYADQGGLILLAKQWVHNSSTIKGSIAEVAFYQNQALIGVLARTFSYLSTHSQLSPDPLFLSKMMSLVSAIILIPLAAWYSIRDRFSFRSFGLFLVLMLLFSPDSRPPHFVMLLPAGAYICYLMYSQSKPRWTYIASTLLISIILSPDIVGRDTYVLASSYSVYFFYLLIQGFYLMRIKARPIVPRTSG